MSYHSHEAGDARTLNLENVVVWGDGEVVAAKSEGHIWEAVTLLALNGVLSIVSLLGTHLLVEKLSEGGWESDERSSGVKYNTSVVKLSGGIAEGNCIKVNLPIGLASQWDLCDLASEVIFVDSTEDGLRLVTLTVIGVSEVESEDWLVQELLVDHVVERRWDLVNGDGIETKTQDTVKSTEGKGKTWLLGSFGEDLVLDLQITD